MELKSGCESIRGITIYNWKKRLNKTLDPNKCVLVENSSEFVRNYLGMYSCNKIVCHGVSCPNCIIDTEYRIVTTEELKEQIEKCEKEIETIQNNIKFMEDILNGLEGE